jgi:heat shock protein HslJ
MNLAHLLAAASLALLSLVPSAPAAEAPFAKSTWVLSELNGAPVAKAKGQLAVQTISFDPKEPRVSGHGGINRFSGGYRLEGDKLKLGPMMSTRMGGEDAAMQAESKYLIALEGVTGWKWATPEKETLQLLNGEKVVASFVKSGAK